MNTNRPGAFPEEQNGCGNSFISDNDLPERSDNELAERSDNDLPGTAGSGWSAGASPGTMGPIDRFFVNMEGEEAFSGEPVSSPVPRQAPTAGMDDVPTRRTDGGMDPFSAPYYDGRGEYPESISGWGNDAVNVGTAGSVGKTGTKKAGLIIMLAVLLTGIGIGLFFGIRHFASAPRGEELVPVETGSETPPSEETTETTAEPSSEEPTTTETLIPVGTSEPIFLTPTEEDFEALGTDFDSDSLLNRLPLTFLQEGSPHLADFHSGTLDTAGLKKHLIFISISTLYSYYFGEPEQTGFPEGESPFGGLRNCVRYSEKNILWIAENVLNMKGSFSREAFASAGPYVCRYLDGYYYFPSEGFDADQIRSRMIDKKELGDNRFEITMRYMVVGYDGWKGLSGDGVGKATVALKEIDGKRVWSIYDYRAEVSFNGGNMLNRPSPSEVFAFYRQQIDEIIRQNQDGRNPETAGFNLYDINGDGIEELFLHCGYRTNTADRGILVCSYSADKGGWIPGSINAMAGIIYDTCLIPGEIRAVCAYHGRMAEFSYQLNNDALTETIVTDWHEQGDTEYQDSKEQYRYMQVIDEWIPLENAESYFNDLIR